MEFRLLGAVSVATENGELALGPAKRSSVLAALLLRPNTAVSVDQLIAALWEEEPPTHARSVLHSHVSRLRALLSGSDAAAYGVDLATQGSAYTLHMPESLLDAHRFEELVALAKAQRNPADSVLMLREALALWQGPALTGTVASPPLRAAAQALEELRLTSVEALAEAYGELGEHVTAAAVLRTEAVANPLHEPLTAALMMSLYRAGRQSDALDWYHRTRTLLADELGVDPGHRLTEAYTVILRAKEPPPVEEEREQQEQRPKPATGRPEAPELLPRPPRGFTGRREELALLTSATAAPDAPVCLVTGPAGVGKTALAVHWAHEHRTAFPDGRLFADLQGFSDTPSPETPEVLREFLVALGVPARQIPETGAAMGALYRSLTADRRLLVVLDNAGGSEQVRPLLPGGDRCATVVTSRHRLGGLVATDAARPVALTHLPAPDSAALLAAVLGEERVAAEPEAAERLAGLCDGLPLALRVTAARLAGQPQWTLTAMAGELADEQRRLSLLDIEDTSVSAALRLTVQQLPDKAARMFRFLGVHTGPDLDGYTAGALARTSHGQAAAALERLAAAHLVTESAPGRYTLHDLVRLYARQLAPDTDPEALPRLLDHYLYTALAATAAAEPGSQPCCAPPSDARRPPAVREFESRSAAMAWYEAERGNLLGAVAAAAATGAHDRAWRLALLQWPLILWRVRDSWEPLLDQALVSAEHEADDDARSRTLALLGWVLHEEGRDAEALIHLEKAPELAARSGHVLSESIACVNLAVVLSRSGESDRAGHLLTRAWTLARRARHPSTESLALQHLAGHCLNTGAYQEAEEYALRGLELAPPAEAAVSRVRLRTMYGDALACLNRPDEAETQLGRAAREARSLGDLDGAAAARELLARLSETRQKSPGPAR